MRADCAYKVVKVVEQDKLPVRCGKTFALSFSRPILLRTAFYSVIQAAACMQSLSTTDLSGQQLLSEFSDSLPVVDKR